MVQNDLLELLGKAVTCALLGKSGPQRSRIISMLYNVILIVVIIVALKVSSKLFRIGWKNK